MSSDQIIMKYKIIRQNI